MPLAGFARLSRREQASSLGSLVSRSASLATSCGPSSATARERPSANPTLKAQDSNDKRLRNPGLPETLLARHLAWQWQHASEACGALKELEAPDIPTAPVRATGRSWPHGSDRCALALVRLHHDVLCSSLPHLIYSHFCGPAPCKLSLAESQFLTGWSSMGH